MSTAPAERQFSRRAEGMQGRTPLGVGWRGGRYGVPGRIRTRDPLLRRQLLCPN